MLPNTYYVKRAEVLLETGICRDLFYKMCKAGTLTPVVLPGCKYSRFRRSEIVKVFNLKETRT